MKEFKDRVAVVIGAASGIGREIVKNFVEAGMKVVLADVDVFFDLFIFDFQRSEYILLQSFLTESSLHNS